MSLAVLRDLSMHPSAACRNFIHWQCLANFCGYRSGGRSLFTLINENEHRERRQFFNAAFHKIALVSLMDEFNEATTALIHKLEKDLKDSSSGEIEVDIATLFGKTTLDVIAKVAFGLNLNSGTLIDDLDRSYLLVPIRTGLHIWFHFFSFSSNWWW